MAASSNPVEEQWQWVMRQIVRRIAAETRAEAHALCALAARTRQHTQHAREYARWYRTYALAVRVERHALHRAFSAMTVGKPERRCPLRRLSR